MTNASTQSPYTALDPTKRQTRLVTLHPRSNTGGPETTSDDSDSRSYNIAKLKSDDPIVCNLETVDLDSKLSYEALSYEWGPKDSPMHQITLNGSPWLVRDNLWWGLYHVRHESEKRVLWIDALCIDQGNDVERNRQVGQMKDIYFESWRVVAWIGLGYAQVDGSHYRYGHLACKFLDNFSELLVAMDYEDEEVSDDIKMQVLRDRNSENWKALSLMFGNRYWTRLWIIQEILLAKKLIVQCGPREVPWPQISYLWLCVEGVYFPGLPHDGDDLRQYPAFTLEGIRRGRSIGSKTGPHGLVELLIEFKDAGCEEIRDKVFGILGLTDDCCANANAADYRLSTLEVASRVITHHLSHDWLWRDDVIIEQCRTVLSTLNIAPYEFVAHQTRSSTPSEIRSTMSKSDRLHALLLADLMNNDLDIPSPD